jgi:hypothetical protein
VDEGLDEAWRRRITDAGAELVVAPFEDNES